MHIQTIRCVIAAVLIGCGSSQTPPPNPPPGEPASEPAAGERKALTQEECEAQGGSVVGDIGDGATQRPDYVCPSGSAPLGNIKPPEGGPIAIEGSVCCPP